MLHAHKRLVIMIIVSLLSVSLALAGGRRERDQEEQLDPAPSTPRQRIEFGQEAERPEPDAPEQETRQQERDDSPDPGRSPWILADHRLDQTLEREISAIIQEGYTPVGMDRTAEGISILYLLSEAVLFDRWIIHEFTDLSVLNDEFSAFLVNGWLPMGFSKDGDSITTFFVRSEDVEFIGWRMHQISVGDMQAVFDVVESYLQQSYVPFGISIDDTDNQVWLLFLETKATLVRDGAVTNVLINAFPEDGIVDGVNNDVINGALPWGMSRGREASFFLYLF